MVIEFNNNVMVNCDQIGMEYQFILETNLS